MKRVVRCGVFETNSSSVHSLTMCSKTEWDTWKQGDLWLYNGSLFSKPDIIAILEKFSWFNKYNFEAMSDEDWEEFCEDNQIFSWDSYNKYIGRHSHEMFNQTYTTSNGEEICAFGYYGYE
jgi:hypothetical protein